MIIDHVGYHVGDLHLSKSFYVQALRPLGIGIVKEGEGWSFMGHDGKGQFWIDAFGAAPGGIHFAFVANRMYSFGPHGVERASGLN